MILCDLPYGTTENKWDSVIPLDKLWEQYERIIKDNGAIVLFSQQPFTSTLICSNYRLFRYEWIWKKSQGTGFLRAKQAPLKIHENICVFYKHLPTYNPQFTEGKPYKQEPTNKSSNNYGELKKYASSSDGKRYPVDLIQFKSERGLHPTQKPVELLEYLIRTYTNSGDLVVDNCMGSGSTGVACVRTNRDFIGIELDDDYFKTASDRINAELAQGRLFDE